MGAADGSTLMRALLWTIKGKKELSRRQGSGFTGLVTFLTKGHEVWIMTVLDPSGCRDGLWSFIKGGHPSKATSPSH